MKFTAAPDGSQSALALVAVLTTICGTGAFLFAASVNGALAVPIATHQTLVADIVAIGAVILWVWLAARRSRQHAIALVMHAVRIVFTPPAVVRSVLLLLLIGVPLTVFYLVALPAERFGALAWGALQFLTAGDALAAVLIGFGVSTSFALNLAAQRARAAQTTITFGGVIAALLPSSLCCTTLIPSALAALGASAPAIMHTSGRFQGFFADYSALCSSIA